MKKLLQTLTESFGPPGYEDEIREVVRKELKPLADETRLDALGNLIACRHPGKTTKAPRKIMITAHMDAIGFMVSHVDGNGFVRFSPLGNLPRRSVSGGRVRFSNGTRGVIGLPGVGSPEKGNELPTLDKFFLDVGATSPEDCPVGIGDVAVFDCPYDEFGDRLVGSSLGSRVGVLVAIEALRSLEFVSHDVTLVFTAQAELGGRGTAVATYGIDPDIGVALDVSPAGDLPDSHQPAIALGQGPCIKIQDAGMIADPRVVNWMIRAAEKNKIPYQREVLLAVDTGARRIQFARAGVPTGGISIPVRYHHSSSEMVDYSDVRAAVKLLAAVLQTPIGL